MRVVVISIFVDDQAHVITPTRISRHALAWSRASRDSRRCVPTPSCVVAAHPERDALFDEDVAAALALSADQRVELERICGQNREAVSAAMQDVRSARMSISAYQGHAVNVHRQGDARLLAVLSSDQRTIFDQLQRGDVSSGTH